MKLYTNKEMKIWYKWYIWSVLKILRYILMIFFVDYYVYVSFWYINWPREYLNWGHSWRPCWVSFWRDYFPFSCPRLCSLPWNPAAASPPSRALRCSPGHTLYTLHVSRECRDKGMTNDDLGNAVPTHHKRGDGIRHQQPLHTGLAPQLVHDEFLSLFLN